MTIDTLRVARAALENAHALFPCEMYAEAIAKIDAAMAAPSAEPVAPDQRMFAIVYDDYDRRHEIVQSEAAARERFKRISDNWNAHLFVKIASNTRDCAYPDAVLATPAQPSAARWPRVVGVSRVIDNDRSLMVCMDSAPTDDELRNLHEHLRTKGA